MMIHNMRNDSLNAVRETLAPQHADSFGRITVQYRSNLGETAVMEYADKTAAMKELGDADVSAVFSLENAPKVGF